MLGQTSLANQHPSQSEADEAVLFPGFASWRSTRLRWTGLGLAVLLLVGVSACALHSLASHTSVEPSQLVSEVAFSPMPAHPVRHPGSGYARPTALYSAVLSGSLPASFPAMTQPLQEARVDYDVNLVEAFESLRSNMPEILRFEGDLQRSMPTNFKIYTEAFKTDFKDPDKTALRLVESVIPSIEIPFSRGVEIRGFESNRRVLEELRTLVGTLRFNRVLVSDSMEASTYMTRNPSTGEDVIESHWKTKLVMNAFWDAGKVSDVIIKGVSRFYLSAEGKIYRQSIDNFNIFVDMEPGLQSNKFMAVTMPQVRELQYQLEKLPLGWPLDSDLVDDRQAAGRQATQTV